MNYVERFRAVMSFQPVDRLPLMEWATWGDKTIDRWHGEGLPAACRTVPEIDRYFDLDPHKQFWFRVMAPGAPPRKGEDGATHGIGELGWVENDDDYEALKPWLYPPVDDMVAEMRPWIAKQQRGEAVVWITLSGFFWYPRTLFGIMPHMYAFFDHPELMHRMNQDLADHSRMILEILADEGVPTFMTFAEDFSYNHGPMLSRQLFDTFLAPYYRQLIPLVRELGIIPVVDSDGDISEVVPWLADVGIDGILPLERQAGVDGNALRERYPELQVIGHFDKMTMTRGEEAMRQEFERLLPLMRSGGFIPSVDHQTPPGVSLESYRVYLELLREYVVKGAPR